ncbi:DUF5721 family protein [Lacrimispora sp. NSJ-141]|uniref:DUF5721 family protein n=1 Tax=Lientehia hominis TaxID=2897778 RepID=A0AAP2WAP5_9FIRM|nr:DUF5721 family protein [Lientehia hominis]MCD2493599.1 DUF5721 family protein [Lientehia hominis]
MIALKIPDKKDFTSKLFLQDTFDAFMVSQASFTTSITVSLDGSLHRDYFTDAEWEEMEQHDFARWPLLKPLCYQIIKGRRLPEHFKIVFMLSRSNTEKLLSGTGLSIPVEQVGGLFLNVRYDQGTLQCVTGVAHSFFTADKSLDRAWDDMIRRHFRSREIFWEED